MKAYDEAFGQPFLKATGITVKEDGTGPTEGAIAAQFKSGKPTWDLVDADPFSAISLGKQGMMEPIDYSIVDKSKMRPGFNWDYAASTYFFSYVIAYDAKKFAADPPKGMADFFDVKKFPGKRSMYKWGAGMWEAALLADGVAPEKLYPLDLKRAHDKIAAFKDNVVSYWGGGAASQQVMLSPAAVCRVPWILAGGEKPRAIRNLVQILRHLQVACQIPHNGDVEHDGPAHLSLAAETEAVTGCQL